MNTLVQRILLYGFCAIIAMPSLGMIVHVGTLSKQDFQSQEQRKRTAFPRLSQSYESTRQWLDQLNRWYEDRYAFRHVLAQAQASLQYRVFGQSAFPQNVVVGKPPFLFLGDAHNQYLSTHAGRSLWNDEALKRLAARFPLQPQKLQAESIPLLLTIPPDKATIYSDYLPSWVPHPNKNLPMAKLRELVGQTPLVRFHYNPELLIEARQFYRPHLYASLDTHWNALGAFLYYDDIMRELSVLLGTPLRTLAMPRSFSKSDIDDFDLKRFIKDPRPHTEWILLDESRWEPVTEPIPESMRDLPPMISTLEPEEAARYIHQNPNALNPQKVLLIGDSFSKLLGPYIWRSFSSVMFLHHQSDMRALVKAAPLYKPDIILIETVERIAGDWLEK